MTFFDFISRLTFLQEVLLFVLFILTVYFLFEIIFSPITYHLYHIEQALEDLTTVLAVFASVPEKERENYFDLRKIGDEDENS